MIQFYKQGWHKKLALYHACFSFKYKAIFSGHLLAYTEHTRIKTRNISKIVSVLCCYKFGIERDSQWTRSYWTGISIVSAAISWYLSSAMPLSVCRFLHWAYLLDYLSRTCSTFVLLDFVMSITVIYLWTQAMCLYSGKCKIKFYILVKWVL